MRVGDVISKPVAHLPCLTAKKNIENPAGKPESQAKIDVKGNRFGNVVTSTPGYQPHVRERESEGGKRERRAERGHPRRAGNRRMHGRKPGIQPTHLLLAWTLRRVRETHGPAKIRNWSTNNHQKTCQSRRLNGVVADDQFNKRKTPGCGGCTITEFGLFLSPAC